MAQPTPPQAEVQMTTLTAAAARTQLSRPVEVTRGQVRSVTLTIPLLSDQSSYLVVRLPNQTVTDLMAYVRALPQAQQRDYLSEWIMRNQQAVLEQYVRTGRTQRAFRYDVVPIRDLNTLDSTPRRVEQPPPPVMAVPRREDHVLIEERHFYDHGEDVPPAGWRQPRNERELPLEVRTRANYFQPRHEAGKIPQGNGRIEEFQGNRYLYLACQHGPDRGNPRWHDSVSVYLPAENVQPAPVQLPALPAEISGGSGTVQDPYVVAPRTNRGSAQATVVRPIRATMTFGTTVFRVNLTEAQLSPANIEATRTELANLLKAGIIRSAAQAQPRVDTASSSFQTDADRVARREVAALEAINPPPNVSVAGPIVPPPTAPVVARNREVQSGSGTRSSPFMVNVLRGRSSASDTGGQEVDMGVNFDVGGTVHFRFNFTLNQISNSTIDQTYSEVIRIARATISNMPDYIGGRVGLRQDLQGFKDSLRGMLASHPEVIRYMDSH